MDWTAFWETQIYGVPYFLTGLIFSIWAIPYYTARRLEGKNKDFIHEKVSFVLLELCGFLNRVPNEVRGTDNTIAIFQKGKENFVTILRENFFEELIRLEFSKRILLLSEIEAPEQFKIVTAELDRLRSLRIRIEKLNGIHSLHIENQISNQITGICFEIRKFEESYSMNLTYEELLHEKTGKFGILELKDIYERVFSLIQLLVKKNQMVVDLMASSK